MASTVWKGQLVFGLVSVGVKLYRAARKERVRLHYVAPAAADAHVPEIYEEPDEPDPARPAGVISIQRAWPERELRPDAAPPPAPAPVARVTQSLVNPEDRTPVTRGDLLRGHEVAPGRYVTFTQNELRALRPQTSSEMQIVRSVRLEEIDPVYFETSYYIAPNRGSERAYSLLFAALRESRYVALATLTMHGRDHVVVVRPGPRGLLAHTMFYADEVRPESEFEVRISDVAPKELELARKFVEAIAGPFAPEEFKDSQREKLEALIAARVARGEVAPSAPAAGSTASPAGPALDILEALRKSLESRKPAAQTEAPVPRREPGKVTELKKPRKRHA